MYAIRSYYELQSLDRRIRRIEDTVTSRDYDWDRRMNG